MPYIIGLLLGTFLVSAWSHRRGTGFWFGFFWSFLLSPVLGALLVLARRPRGRVLVRGNELLEHDPAAPRPIFCVAMIVSLFLAILVWANI